MQNPFDNYVAPQDEDKMQAFIRLANEVSTLEDAKIELELEIKQLGARLNSIKTNELPEMFAELGISEFTLANGGKLKIKEVVAGSLPKEADKKKEALDWLDANEGSDLIKTIVELDFKKGEDNRAKNAIAMLEEQGYEPSVEKGVHAQSLCAFARERLKNGEELPIEKLGLYVGKTTEFKRGKS